MDDLTFVLNEAGTEYSLTECNEYASGDLEIPSAYQDFPVTTVADKAFKDCTSLTSITIPDSVTTIGEESFFNTGITSIVVPDSVTSIGYAAFQNCSSLTTVTLPDALTELEAFTFYREDWYLGSLTSINIPSNIEQIGDSAIPIAFEIPDSVTNYGPGNGGGFGFLFDPTVIFSGGLGYRLSSSGENAYIVELEGQPDFFGSGTGTTLSGDIIIPQTIDGAAVQSVTFSGWVSFDSNSAPGITGITVSEGIVSIAEAAFWEFEDLVNVNLPDSLTLIDWVAFRGCTSLSSITIPKNVSDIGGSVFNGASNLNEIIVDPDNAHYVSVDNSLYDISLQTLVRCRADATDFIVPDTVTTIENGAFAGCSNLTSVTIPNSVTSIRGSAFGECTGLTSITIPDSVTSIEASTFYNCTSLTTITIPDSVTLIEEDAFGGCTGLISITIPDSVTSIEKDAFFGCSNLTSITIGAGVDSLEGFTSSFALENVPTINISSDNPYITVIDGVVFNQAKDTLLEYLFTNTGGSYTIPDGVTSIGDKAFQGSGLTSITIPDSVTSIGNGAFQDCSSLTGITIPGSVTTIGNGAFEYCGSLTSIIFNGTAPTVETNSFSNIASNPKAFVLDYNGTSFGDIGNSWNGLLVSAGLSFSQNSDNTYTLTDCDTSITGHLVIPSAYQGSPVTIIGSSAFQDSGLTSITIPDSVTSIGSTAFQDCSGLTSITIPDGVTSIGNYAFIGCTSLTSVTIPSSVISIGYNAFGGGDYSLVPLDQVTIPYKFVASKSTFGIRPEATLTIDFTDVTTGLLADTGFINGVTEEVTFDSTSIEQAIADEAASRAAADANLQQQIDNLQIYIDAAVAQARSDGVTAGIQAVTSDPHSYQLYNESSIIEMNVTNPTLSMLNESEQAQVEFTLETSTDLEDWSIEERIQRTVNAPEDKFFIRIKNGIPYVNPTVLVFNHPSYGEILTDQSGNVLYGFSIDSVGGDPSFSGSAWPLALQSTDPEPDAGITATLTSETFSNTSGGPWLKINNRPVYTYASDSEPNQASGHGLGSVWFTIKPDGTLNQ